MDKKKKSGESIQLLTWIRARKIVQYLTLLAFIILFITSRWGGWPAPLVNIFMRLDPLLTLSHLIANRTFLAGSALAILVIILTLVFGRAWCGWFCPLGTTLDLFSPHASERHRSKYPNGRIEKFENWRGIKYFLLLTILIAALFGNLTLLILDPITIIFRTLTISVWPALDQAITWLETGVYHLPSLANSVSSIDAWIRPLVFPAEPVFFRDVILYAAVFLGVIGLNFLAPRFWCRYLCPLGGLLGIVSKISLFRREVSPECKGCTLCTRACPTGTINPSNGYASDASECTLCLDCLDTCPRNGILIKPIFSLSEWNDYDPGRRHVLASFGITLAALALFRSDAQSKREPPFLLRPPGARENNLLSKCLRCSECIRTCPTSALQPSLTEAGVEGLWTPVIIPRLGYCDYSCNSCGQICPVQAIPPFNLQDKRTLVIGKAYINQHRCIAWSDHQPCIVCEEMCPMPEKAVHLNEIEMTDDYGQIVTIQLPYVLREQCIGCGICEYKCPVNGEAAIRVYVPGTEVPF